jgi:serine/threonine-protein kinase
MKTRAKLRNVDLLEDENEGDDITTPGPTTATSGRRLGRYLMFEEIARGEMGALHLGCELEPGAPRPVAIKHLYPWLAANSSYASTYLREARLAARIDHPNVARTIDVVTGPANGQLYLVMDYVHGDTLAHLLTQNRRHEGAGPPLAIVAGVMSGLLRGLHAVQEATLAEALPAQSAQREVSPQDVIVGLDGVTRIFEFGAINLAHGHMRELVSGRGADVFSAGAMLWEILAGRRLFADPADQDVFFTSGANLTPPPSHFNPEVPPELDAVVLRALRKDRDRRFPSSRAFAEAIEAAFTPALPREIGDWVARTSTRLLAARAVRVAGITRAAPAPALAEPTVRGSRSAPRSWLPIAAAVAVTAAAALVGAGLWARGGEPGRASLRPASLPSRVVQEAVAAEVAPAVPAQVAAAVPALVPSEDAVVDDAPALTSMQRMQHPLLRASRPSLARIARLNGAALKAYRRLDPPTARRRLHAALALCARSGLGRHAIAARTHALLGVVLAGGFKQPELGAEQFRIALRIDPRVPLPPRYASESDVAAAFRNAVAAADR